MIQQLTTSEIEVLQHAANGLGLKGTARAAGIPMHSVKGRRESARHKLGAANVTQSVARAVSLGYIAGDQA